MTDGFFLAILAGAGCMIAGMCIGVLISRWRP